MPAGRGARGGPAARPTAGGGGRAAGPPPNTPAVPADVEDAAEKEAERDETEAPQLGVCEARPGQGPPRGGLLPAGGRLATQRVLALRARHEGPFARAGRPPSPGVRPAWRSARP